jgi:hypothetical protein
MTRGTELASADIGGDYRGWMHIDTCMTVLQVAYMKFHPSNWHLVGVFIAYDAIQIILILYLSKA